MVVGFLALLYLPRWVTGIFPIVIAERQKNQHWECSPIMDCRNGQWRALNSSLYTVLCSILWLGRQPSDTVWYDIEIILLDLYTS